MILTLTVLNGPHHGQAATVAAGTPRTFGRGAAADIVVQDDYLSDVHFALYCDEGGARVRDLNSFNGTFVNDASVQDAVLRHGDRVRAGNTWFEVALSAPQAVAAAIPENPEEFTPAMLATGMRSEPSDLARWALTSEELPLFAVIDVAKNPDLIELLNDSGDEFCAFDETKEPDDLGETAPFLMSLTHGTDGFADLLDKTWGNGQVMFVTSSETFLDVYNHLLLQMDFDEHGEFVTPGWYAPAELHDLLREAPADDVKELFGPIAAFLVESTEPRTLIRYTHVDGKVHAEAVPLVMPNAATLG